MGNMKSDKEYAEEYKRMPPDEQERVRGLRSGLSLPVAMAFHREFEDIKKSHRETSERFDKLAQELRDDGKNQREQLLDAVKTVLAESSKATLALIERLERADKEHEDRLGCLETTAREHEGRFKDIEGDVRALKKQVGIPA
jgi:hypothetical protein